jgi:tol-pal system protein YbgF
MFSGIVMIWKNKLTVFAVMAGLLAGCAAPLQKQTARETILPEIDVDQVRKNAENALRQSMEVKLDLEVLTVKLAELDNRTISLSEDFANVSSAKIEELETRLALITEAFKSQQAQLQQLDAIVQGGVVPVAAAGGTQTKQGTAGSAAANQLYPTGLWRPAGKGTLPGTGAATFSPSSALALVLSPEYDAYQAGLRLFSSRKYQLAIKAFEEMLQQFPQGKYADNANYWLGECYYSLEEFSLAAGYFDKVQAYKGSSKNDDAQFKLGMSFLKMGQQATAKEAFNKLLEQYPGSEYRDRTERFLKQLK